MKVTEQIDALRALATNPVRKLVVPRVLATTLMFPLLTIVASALGIIGGLIIAVATLHLSANFYMRSVIDTVKYNDLASGIGKTFFFGFAAGLIACYNGLRTSGGADGEREVAAQGTNPVGRVGVDARGDAAEEFARLRIAELV